MNNSGHQPCYELLALDSEAAAAALGEWVTGVYWEGWWTHQRPGLWLSPVMQGWFNTLYWQTWLEEVTGAAPFQRNFYHYVMHRPRDVRPPQAFVQSWYQGLWLSPADLRHLTPDLLAAKVGSALQAAELLVDGIPAGGISSSPAAPRAAVAGDCRDFYWPEPLGLAAEPTPGAPRMTTWRFCPLCGMSFVTGGLESFATRWQRHFQADHGRSVGEALALVAQFRPEHKGDWDGSF